MRTDMDLTLLADQANRIFLTPRNLYPWSEIMEGCVVASKSGSPRIYRAVDKNTFRALHREDKSKPVGEPFIRYFVDHRSDLMEELSQVQYREDLDLIADEIVGGLRSVLSHLKPSVLATYHKLRKPVDLALESLVSMSVELEHVRNKLAPLLFLPLDSKMFGHPLLFTESELSRLHLNRDSGFGQVPSRQAYLELQNIVSTKADWVAKETGKTFHPVYFDMLWGNRYKNWGGNLFETIPDRSSAPSKQKRSSLRKIDSKSGTYQKSSEYLPTLINSRPELNSIKDHIGNNLATNYVMGLNGRYYERLQQGIQVAVGLSSAQLVKAINQLIADRIKKGDTGAKHIHVPSSENGRRALILGLWSSREIGVREGEITNIMGKKRRVYGDEHYLPALQNLSY